MHRLRIIAIASLVTTHIAVAQTPPPAASDAETRTVQRIDRFEHIAAFLNLAQGTVRIVAIVPSNDIASAAIVDTIAAVVQSSPSKRLRAYVVLTGESGTPLQAAVLAGRTTDKRIAYFWDATGDATRPWESHPPGVWVYDTAAKFSDRPPTAAMAFQAPAPIDGDALRNTSIELVRKVEAKMSVPATDH